MGRKFEGWGVASASYSIVGPEEARTPCAIGIFKKKLFFSAIVRLTASCGLWNLRANQSASGTQTTASGQAHECWGSWFFFWKSHGTRCPRFGGIDNKRKDLDMVRNFFSWPAVVLWKFKNCAGITLFVCRNRYRTYNSVGFVPGGTFFGNLRPTQDETMFPI